jgi:hypothetical protein
LALVSAWSSPALADGPRAQSADAAAEDARDVIAAGEEIDLRLAFLEERIATQRAHAELYWKGWLTFYAFGTVWQGIQASQATTAADRADAWIGFAKALGATTRFVFDPYSGIRGLDPRPSGWSASPESDLARAEDILEANADTTHPFGPWYAHLINFGINGAHTVIVGAGFDDWQQGLISGLIGVGVGELVILTGPWEADSDLEEYRDGGWRVSAMGAGAAVGGSF